MRKLFFLWFIQGYAALNLTWGVPAVSLDSNPPLGDTDLHPKIAIDPTGNAVAVWGRTTGKGAAEDIWAAVYHHSSRVWMGPTKVSGGGSAANSQVLLDAEGSATLIWEEGFPSQIMTRTLSAQGVWAPDLSAPPKQIHPSPHAQIKPLMGIDSEGNILAIWMEFQNKKYHIHSSYKPRGFWWGDFGAISTGETDACFLTGKEFALNQQGKAIAVWSEQHGNRGEIWGNSFSQGSWRGPFQIFSEEGKIGEHPSVGIDSLGNATIVWCQNGTLFSRSLQQGSLSPKILTVSDPNFFSQHPCVGVDGEGNALVVYERNDWMHKFIASASLPFQGQAWNAPIDLSSPTPRSFGKAGFPTLAFNEIGDAVAIWKEYNGEKLVVGGAGYATGTWSMIKILSSPDQEAGSDGLEDLSISMNTAGNILAIWPEDTSHKGSYQIKATVGVALAATAPLPPKIKIDDPEQIVQIIMGVATGKQVKRRFPAHTDLINILNWDPSNEAVFYRVYRGHLAGLVGTTQATRYEDHRREPKKQETYLITAVDRNGQESPPITLVVKPL